MGERPVEHFADRLLSAVERAETPACVGLDPVWERLPEALRAGAGTRAEAIERFSLEVLEAVVGVVPVVKAQSACFERYGAAGMGALERVCAAARERGLFLILDAKRGDIGTTCEHYAAAAFDAFEADALTVSPYLGPSVVESCFEPMDRAARRTGRGRGLFVLVRTSNPDSDHLQSLAMEGGRTLAQRVAELVHWLGEDRLGGRGYSDIGGVVGATKPDDAADLRRRLHQQILLVPGYGAQGGGVEEVRPLFREGAGAIVTASRSVIYPFQPHEAKWRQSISASAERFASDLRPLMAP